MEWTSHWNGTEWRLSYEGAKLRLRSEIRAHPDGSHEAVNKLDRISGSEWIPLSTDEAAQLSAIERGWVWMVWPQRVGAERMVGFRGFSAIDGEIEQLFFSGLRLRSKDGMRELREPAEAERSFLLSPEEAEIFSKRVKDAGGEIKRAPSWMSVTDEALMMIRDHLTALEALLAADLETLNEADRGDLSGEIEFDQRGGEIRERVERAISLTRSASDGLGFSASDSTQRAQALLKKRELSAAAARVDELLAARERAERIFSRQIAAASERGPKRSPVSEIALRLLMRDLAELWRAEGVSLRETETGIIVRLDDEEIELSRTISKLKRSAPARQDDWPNDEEL